MTGATNQPVVGKVADFFAPYRERHFKKGETIVQAGHEPEGVMYIVEGQVAQYDILPNGTEAIVNIYKVPAFFPMSWAINRTPNNFFFEALAPVTIKQAPADDVVAFLKREPDVAFDLLSRAFRGTEGILSRMTHLMGGSARSRLSFELLTTAYRFGVSLPSDKIRIDITESDLAKRTGLARETISRTLRSLKTDAIVLADPQKTGSFIVDIKLLEKSL